MKMQRDSAWSRCQHVKQKVLFEKGESIKYVFKTTGIFI